MRRFLRTAGAVSSCLIVALALAGCPGKYDSAPQADERETQAMKERYQALIDEAKKLEAGAELDLLHHFSSAVLTQTKKDAFIAQAKAFMESAKAGKFDGLEISGGRAPGKVRLLLLSAGDAKGAVPFVKGADGWKLDDVEAGFGKFDKELNIKGTPPANPPSSLASLSVFQDTQASSLDKVQAALDLALAKDKQTAEKYAGEEKDAWAKAALQYALWKSGGSCDPFAAAFPIAADKQTELYDNDTDAYRTLIKGLTECAGESKSLGTMLQVYKGCHQAEAGPRSEYVDPVVAMADKNPELVLKAALKARIEYDQDPVANILVGALHGEKKSPFYSFVQKKAGRRGRLPKLAQEWVDKMAKRDELEPPGSEEGAKAEGQQ